MGLFDKAKEAHKQKQEEKAERNKIRGNLLVLQMADYMGGYNNTVKATGVLTFYENQIEYKAALNARSSFTFRYDEIANIAVEGKDEVTRRVTVTRLLAVGIFAFALKKKSEDKEAFITLELTDGQEVVFQVNKVSPMELKAKLSKGIAKVKQNAPKAPSSTAPASVADELAKLAKLKQDGILTQAEFDKKKSELLS